MNLQPRERRALIGLAVIAIPVLVWTFATEDGQTVPVVGAISDIPTAEKRLDRLRLLAATVPGKEQVLQKVRGELQERERGLIQADTPAQAQAQLLQVLRKTARTGNIDLRNTEMGAVKPFGDSYGEVAVSANFECGIEQLLQFLADLTAQKEAIGTQELRIGAANPKQKTIPVRITISGLVRRELLPQQKGAGRS